MNTKIQELTDIIYNEGVAKGQAEADQILAQASGPGQRTSPKTYCRCPQGG